MRDKKLGTRGKAEADSRMVGCFPDAIPKAPSGRSLLLYGTLTLTNMGN